MGYRLGIDVGGTFTDLVLYDEASAALAVEKVPSVPADPVRGHRPAASSSSCAGPASRRAPWTTWRTARPWPPMRCSSGRARAPRSSRRGAFAICSRSPGRSGPRSTISSRRSRRRWCRATAASRWPSACWRTDRCASRSISPRSSAVLDATSRRRPTDGPIEALAICFLYAFLAPEHERQVLERARKRLPGASRSWPPTRCTPSSASTSGSAPPWRTPTSPRA